jgi:hypothetical protein
MGLIREYPPDLGGTLKEFYRTIEQVVHRASQLSTDYGQLSTGFSEKHPAVKLRG